MSAKESLKKAGITIVELAGVLAAGFALLKLLEGDDTLLIVLRSIGYIVLALLWGIRTLERYQPLKS